MDKVMAHPTAIDLELDYVSPALVQAYPRQSELWERDAAAYREAAGSRAHLDVAYGDKARQRLDLFAPAGGADGPVALFVHGGYWQSMDKSSFSHLARGANEHGITVAVVGYTLCPEATVAEIVDEIRAAVAFVARRFGKPVTVYGHSAGGHLTACMLATDWRALDASLPADTVPAGLPISGLFDLAPLVHTSVNRKLQLTAPEASRLSPLSWQAPAGRSVIAYVGGSESPEYRRQTRDLVARWRGSGVEITSVELSGADHFTVLAPLTDPASPMTRDLAQLAGSMHPRERSSVRAS